MAHKGRVYRFAFRRDLMVLREYPDLWPNRLLWNEDQFLINGLNDFGRRGTVSGVGSGEAGGATITWRFRFAGVAPLRYFIDFSMSLDDSRGNPRFNFIAEDEANPFHQSRLLFDSLYVPNVQWPVFVWDVNTLSPSWINPDPAWHCQYAFGTIINISPALYPIE